MSLPFLCAPAALLLTALLVPPLRRLAWRLDLVDHPGAGGHKSHTTPTPYGGGIAIWLGALVPLLATLVYTAYPRQQALFVLLAGATAVFALGLADDRRSLSPLIRLVVQLLAAALLPLSAPEFRLGLFGDYAPLSIALSTLWIGAMTNAFNFLDNMDGLSAGVAAIVFLLLAGQALSAEHLAAALLGLSLAGAALGFLGYNFPPARVFMGDAGGLFLGFAAGGLSALLSQHCTQTTAPPIAHFPCRLAPLAALALPVYDLVSVTLIRLYHRQPPWVGDHNHLSHRLVRRGCSRRGAVLLIYLLTLLSGLPALALFGAPRHTWELLLLVPLALFLLLLCEVRRSPLGSASKAQPPPGVE